VETSNALMLYNRIHSGGPRSLWQRIRDAPHLLARMLRDEARIPVLQMTFIRWRILLAAFSGLLYMLLPYDILPEATLGLFGYVDDALFFGFLFLNMAAVFRGILLTREELH